MTSHHSSNMQSLKLDENEKLLYKNFTIIINRQLGKGGFGQIYLGRNIKENYPIAIKVEENGTRSHLFLEYEILQDIQGDEGIPKVYKFKQGHKHNYLIMELLGKSIDKLFSECKKNFSYKTIFQIGYQMIQRIEYIHSKGYIHRDIKPGNFVIGKGDKSKIIYIIDFGLSKRYIDKNNQKHIPYKEGKGLTGTARYVSLFTHYGIEQSRRDDIEGIAYNLIYLAKGKLPWQGVKTKNKKEKHKKIMESKLAYSPEQLCKDLPDEFVNLLKYSRNLEFEEKPDYKSIKVMFKNHIIKSGGTMNFEFGYSHLPFLYSSSYSSLNTKHMAILLLSLPMYICLFLMSSVIICLLGYISSHWHIPSLSIAIMALEYMEEISSNCLSSAL